MNDSISITRHRGDLAFKALFEIDQLSTLLRAEIEKVQPSMSTPIYFAPAMLQRIGLLSDIVSECLGNGDDWGDRELEQMVLHGDDTSVTAHARAGASAEDPGTLRHGDVDDPPVSREEPPTGRGGLEPELLNIVDGATEECGKVANHLREFIEVEDTCGDIAPVARGALLRVVQLAELIATAAGVFPQDEPAPIEELHRILGAARGPGAPGAARR